MRIPRWDPSETIGQCYIRVHRAEGLGVRCQTLMKFHSTRLLKIFWRRRASVSRIVPASPFHGPCFPCRSQNSLESSEHIWNSLSSRLNPDAAVSFRCTADLPGSEMIFCCKMWNFIACLLRSSSSPSMLSFDFSYSLSLVSFRCRTLSRCILLKECQESSAGRILGL